MREAAIRSLGYFGEPVGLDALLRAGQDEVLAVRLAALEGLSVYEDPRATAVICASLTDAAPAVRAAAVRALRFAPATLAVEPLVQALGDGDMWVRVHACRSLAHFRDPAAERAITTLTTDKMPPVRAAAAATLGMYGGKHAVTWLQSLLHDPEPEVVVQAIQGLAATHHPAAIPILFDLATQAGGDVQQQAIAALGQHGSAEAVASLRRLVELACRPELSLTALLQTHAPEAITTIVQALQQTELRKVACEAASQLGEAALPALEQLLQQPDSSIETRLAVVQVLQRIHTLRATDMLMQCLHDSASQVRLAAIHDLNEVGAPLAQAAIARVAQTDPDGQVRRRALLAVRHLA